MSDKKPFYETATGDVWALNQSSSNGAILDRIDHTLTHIDSMLVTFTAQDEDVGNYMFAVQDRFYELRTLLECFIDRQKAGG